MNGDFVKAFYIEEGFGELESIDFANGSMYLLFNGKPDYLHYSVYKANLSFRADQKVSFANSSVTKTFKQNETFANKATTTGNGAITYSSSNANVASVNSSTGEVTVKGAGTATITATAAATSTYGVASATYTVTINKANRTITFANSSVTKTYGDVNFTNVATKTGDGTVAYSSSNANVASVNSSTGEVTIKSAGTANITASVAATSNYNATSVSYTLTINKKRSAEPEETSGAPDTGANTKMEENNSFVMAYILPIVAIGIVATGFVRHRNKGHRKFEF